MFDYLVVGAGIIGLTAACALGKKGAKVLVIDKNHAHMPWTEQANARIHAYNLKSIAYLKTLDILDALPERSYHEFNAMEVLGGGSSVLLGNKEDRMGIFLADTAICQTILELLNAMPNVSVIWQEKILDIKQSTDQVTLNTENNSFCSKALIAADGARSFIRHHIGIKSMILNYEQTCFVGFATFIGDHQKTAWQKFIEHGTIGYLPYGENTYSLALSLDNTIAKNFQNCSNAIIDYLNANTLPAKVEKITHLSNCQSFPLYAMHAKNYYKDNIVLIGDAAHSIHPLAGLGLNLGIADIEFLMNVLCDDFRASFKAYDKAQFTTNASVMHGLTCMQKLFKFQALSKIAFNLANKSELIKSSLNKIANQEPVLKCSF